MPSSNQREVKSPWSLPLTCWDSMKGGRWGMGFCWSFLFTCLFVFGLSSGHGASGSPGEIPALMLFSNSCPHIPISW